MDGLIELLCPPFRDSVQRFFHAEVAVRWCVADGLIVFLWWLFCRKNIYKEIWCQRTSHVYSRDAFSRNWQWENVFAERTSIWLIYFGCMTVCKLYYGAPLFRIMTHTYWITADRNYVDQPRRCLRTLILFIGHFCQTNCTDIVALNVAYDKNRANYLSIYLNLAFTPGDNAVTISTLVRKQLVVRRPYCQSCARYWGHSTVEGQMNVWYTTLWYARLVSDAGKLAKRISSEMFVCIFERF